MPHKFVVGQIVDLMHRPLRAAATGEYEIRRLMPAAYDGKSEDFVYRIKSAAENHERVVSESEIVATSGPENIFSSKAHAAPASPAETTKSVFR